MLEQFGVTGSTLTVAGWAFDPDAPASPVQVHIYADGRGVPMLAAGSTASSATPQMTAEHGFSWSTGLSGGRHQVCVYAIDATAGMGNTVLGCQTVTVVTSPPVGALERLAISGSDVTVTGWALDPDAPTSPIQVHIYVDGRGLPVLTGTAPAAGYPTALEQSAFTGTLSLSRGAHRVCAYAIDHEGVAGNTVLGCRSVDV
jgi:hypothetical protein